MKLEENSSSVSLVGEKCASNTKRNFFSVERKYKTRQLRGFTLSETNRSESKNEKKKDKAREKNESEKKKLEVEKSIPKFSRSQLCEIIFLLIIRCFSRRYSRSLNITRRWILSRGNFLLIREPEAEMR